MRKEAVLVAVGLVLAGLVVGALLIFGEGPEMVQGSDREPGQTSPMTGTGPGAGEPTEMETEAEDAVARAPVSPTSTSGSLLVTVLWAEGTPAPDVAISFRSMTRGLPLTVFERAVSDERGEVRVEGLPAGDLRLRSDRGGLVDVEVVAGRQDEHDFILPEGVDITGVVTDRRDRPVAGATVWLQTEYTDWSAGRVLTRTDADGTFALTGIPPGLSLGAVASGYGPSVLLDLDTVDTSSPPVSVHLVLEDGSGDVEGRVVSMAGAPVPGALVAAGRHPDRMEHRGRDQWIERWSQRTATSDGDGRFVLTGIVTGTVPVAVRAKGFGFWRTEAEVTDGEETWLDVTLGEAVTVTGTVTDEQGEPIAGASLRVYDQEPRTPFIQGGQIDFDETFGYVGAMSDTRGRYRLDNATPGEVHLFAQAPREPMSRGTVPFARAVLQAEPGDELEWNPVVGPGRMIEGIVLYADGYPMENVFITAKEEQGVEQHVLVNDGEGRFRFIALEGASYSLHVQYWNPPPNTPPLERGGVVPGQGAVELRAPFNKPVEGPKGMVRGRIEDVGERIAHVNVLQLHLVSDEHWWRTNPVIEGDAFSFEDVEAGGYRVVALAGDIVIAQGERFEIGPGETRDIGVLTTEPSGAVVITLDRGEEALELEPRFHLIQEGWSRGSTVSAGRRSEVRVDNLNPGIYRVSGNVNYSGDIPGMMSLEGEVEVRVGEESEVHFTLRPAALMRFELWFPQGRPTGTSTMKIFGADGEVVLEYDRTHGEVPPRPYARGAHVPRGQWTVEVTSDTGLSGSTQFRVESLNGEQPVVRVDVR